jgi:nitroreductase
LTRITLKESEVTAIRDEALKSIATKLKVRVQDLPDSIENAVAEAVQSTLDTRAFLPRPVPREAIAQILEASRWAPSACNRQQWRVTVAGGAACRALAEQLMAHARTQEPHAPCAPGALAADLAQQAAQMGRSPWEYVVVGSYGFYGAPAVVVVSQPGGGGNDVAQFVTTMLIAAHSLGLGTCWLGYPLSQADLIRQMLDIPEDERIRAVIALGYPDPDAPANVYRSPRDELETFVRWVGFE